MLENHDKYYTELDKQLQQLAMVDWPAFVRLIGEDHIMSAKICMLKSQGKSYNQMAVKLNTKKHKAVHACKKCPDPSEGPITGGK